MVNLTNCGYRKPGWASTPPLDLAHIIHRLLRNELMSGDEVFDLA